MAQPANLFDTYDAVGNREELSDVIYNISPTETPFVSSIKKGKASETYFEWQTEALAAADDTNAHIDGDDTTTAASVATTRVGNRTQIMKKSFNISGTQEAVNSAGRKSEIAHQSAKKGMELKRDMEAILTGKQNQVTGNSTTARKTQAFESWCSTTALHGTSGSTSSGTVTDGTQRAFTKTLLDTAIQTIYTNGGKPTKISVGPFNKGVFSGFSGQSTQYTEPRKDGQLAIYASASVYISNFGTMTVMPNLFQRERTALIYDPTMWCVKTLRPFMREKLAKSGDSQPFHILQECGLEASNEASSGKVADLTTS